MSVRGGGHSRQPHASTIILHKTLFDAMHIRCTHTLYLCILYACSNTKNCMSSILVILLWLYICRIGILWNDHGMAVHVQNCLINTKEINTSWIYVHICTCMFTCICNKTNIHRILYIEKVFTQAQVQIVPWYVLHMCIL